MTPYIKALKSNLEYSILCKQKFLESPIQLELFGQVAAAVIQCYRQGGRLLIAGNGGSAADAQHLAAEFVCKMAQPREALPAEALTTDSSTLTAIGNDYGYQFIFSRQLAAKARNKDIFLGITTSGASENIYQALLQCQSMGLQSILFSGKDGGRCKALATYCLLAPGSNTSAIQEIHIVLAHTLVGIVEEALLKKSGSVEAGSRVGQESSHSK